MSEQDLKEFQEAAKRLQEARTPKSALEMLIREGYCDAEKQLTEFYR